MRFVETAAGVRELTRSLHDSTSFVRPVFKSCSTHPASGELSLVFARNLESGASYVVAKNHHEVQRAPESAFRVLRGVSPATFVCSDLKAFTQSLTAPKARVVDAEMLAWWTGADISFGLSSGNVVGEAPNRLWHTPVYVLAQQLEQEADSVQALWEESKDVACSKPFSAYTAFLPALAFLESQGLKVDEERFEEHFGDKPEHARRGFVYPNYRLYTSTGRPSNAFGKVNYAALEKGEERSAFVSRFDGGRLAELDYDAFHLRLVADEVGYEFGDVSAHRHLGRQYFGTDALSAGQYERSKKQTFFWLYNGLTKEALDYEFFRRVQELVDEKWALYKEQGYVETLGVGRKLQGIQDPTPNKVLNYLLQSYETEVALTALARLRRVLDAQSESPVPCLYTFDSFLFDCCEGADLAPARKALSYNGKYPMSLSSGSNYAEL